MLRNDHHGCADMCLLWWVISIKKQAARIEGLLAISALHVDKSYFCSMPFSHRTECQHDIWTKSLNPNKSIIEIDLLLGSWLWSYFCVFIYFFKRPSNFCDKWRLKILLCGWISSRMSLWYLWWKSACKVTSDSPSRRSTFCPRYLPPKKWKEHEVWSD